MRMLLSFGILACVGTLAAADQRQVALSANEAFEKGTETSGLRYDPVRKGVILYDHVLVEDDGPGIATDAKMTNPDDRSPMQELSDSNRIKKVLHVVRPEAIEARLYLPLAVKVVVNGTLLDTSTAIPYWSDDADYTLVPPGLLKAGDNEIVVYKPDGKVGIKTAYRRFIVLNAPERKDWPKRSSLSTDAGKTWSQIEDEYMVRLHLQQHVPAGHLVSPVIDMGDATRQLKGDIQVSGVALNADLDTPAGTSVGFQIRYGSTPVVDQQHWSTWRAVTDPVQAGCRYMQWKASCATSDGCATPVLRHVTATFIGVEERIPEWAARASVTSSANEEILYTSLPFEYEDPNHPKCVALRDKYGFDEAVAVGKTELEKVMILKNWVSKQWRFRAPIDNYPAWDADEIITRQIGFCSQFAMVFMQCAASLGYTARYTFAFHPGTIKAGHEVNEIWLNDLKKWIFVDANNNTINVDPATNTPLSMIEIHDRMRKLCYGDQVALYDRRPKEWKFAPDIKIIHGLDTTPFPGQDVTDTPKTWPQWMKWLHVRYVPRNNFYAHQYPVPRVQGMTFDYADHYAYIDELTPADLRYRHFITRKADLYWTLNQVRFDATYAAPGTLKIRMGTVTPNFKSFVVKIDSSEEKPSDSECAWTLHPGSNRLEMKTVNTAGVCGPISHLQVEYH